MEQAASQMNCTPARRILDAYLRQYKYNPLIELNDDLLLLISINVGFEKLLLIFNESPIDISSIKSHIKDLWERNIQLETGSLPPLNLALNCDKYIDIMRKCKTSPLYSDQISAGVLFFLYTWVQNMDAEHLLTRYSIHKNIWLDKLKNSPEMYIETHQLPAHKMDTNQIEYAIAQLDGPNVMVRFLQHLL